jgi:hypothetical protein
MSNSTGKTDIPSQDMKLQMTKKIANYFNAHFTNAHKLANNLKKQEKYDMIYLTAIGLTPGGSSTHIHT